MHQQTTITTGERLTAPTPKFFRFIRNAGAVIGAVGAALAYYQHNGEAFGAALPPLLDYISGAAVSIGGVIAALVAQFTVDYPAYQKQHELDAIK